MGMLALDLILRWMHIFGAIMLVGSTIFMRTAYLPAKELSDFEPKPEFAEWLRVAWSRKVLLASAQLLISGMVSFVLLVQRDVINKGVCEDELIESIGIAARQGYSGAKLYFMIGLPGERPEDIVGIIASEPVLVA